MLGLADSVGQGGSHKQLDLVQAWHGGPLPAWWGWWNWPYWWFAHNGLGEFRWQVKLEPGATAKLEASWHYFWRWGSADEMGSTPTPHERKPP